MPIDHARLEFILKKLRKDKFISDSDDAFIATAVEAWWLIEQLRKDPPDEVAQIIIYHDNPDFGGPNSVVETDFDAFDDRRQRFTGSTVLEALRAAKTAYDADAAAAEADKLLRAQERKDEGR
jgi:hypothetical protein